MDLASGPPPIPPPHGISVERREGGETIVDYRNTGMPGLYFMLGILLAAAWGAVGLFYATLSGGVPGGEKDFGGIVFGFIIFTSIALAATYHYFRSLFETRHLIVQRGQVILEKRFLMRKKCRILPKESILEIKQVQDAWNASDDGSVCVGWGLQVMVRVDPMYSPSPHEEKVEIISTQPHEKSLWLGQLLSEWAGSELQQA